MPDNEIVQLAQQFKDELEALDEEALARIVTAYQRIYRTLQDKIDALLMEIETMDAPTVTQASKLARYKALEEQIINEVEKFQAYLSTEIQNAAQLSFETSGQQAAQLVEELIAQAGIQAQLGSLPTDAFEALVAFLQEGSPLYDRINLLAGTVADYVRNTLLEAVALGYNPRKTAGLIAEAFGRGLTDALRMARTAQLWASRAATQAQYQLNADIVVGWQWFATLDDTVCQSCIVMHGTVHGLDEILNDHHNGRCAMLPIVAGFDNPLEQTGVQWFESLSEAKQRQILGPGKFEAWKQGKFTLPQLSREHNDDVYGAMRVETPLKNLIND